MAFAERNQEIQTLPAKTATEAFAVGIRLRRPCRRAENTHAEPRDRLVECAGKDAVPVVEHESVRMVAGQSFPELLQGPVRRRMGGRIVMENAASAHPHQQEDVEGAKRGRQHDKEVACHDLFGVIVDESEPALLGVWRAHRADTSRPSEWKPGFPALTAARWRCVPVPRWGCLLPSRGATSGGSWAGAVGPPRPDLPLLEQGQLLSQEKVLGHQRRPRTCGDGGQLD